MAGIVKVANTEEGLRVERLGMGKAKAMDDEADGGS